MSSRQSFFAASMGLIANTAGRPPWSSPFHASSVLRPQCRGHMRALAHSRRLNAGPYSLIARGRPHGRHRARCKNMPRAIILLLPSFLPTPIYATLARRRAEPSRAARGDRSNSQFGHANGTKSTHFGNYQGRGSYSGGGSGKGHSKRYRKGREREERQTPKRSAHRKSKLSK